MSNRYRNPFKIRATEKLESDNNFLRMYSPIVLDELIEQNKAGKLWNNILLIRSSPGAGKTSILKILEPGSLVTLSNNKSASNYKEIIDYLRKIDVFDDYGRICVAGVYMSCARNYEVIEDLDISEGKRMNTFFALINSRIILSTLKSILSLHPGIDLNEIIITGSSFDYSYLDIPLPLKGTQLFEWAASIEKSVFKAIDSFLPITNSITGHSELFAFDLMNLSNISVRDKQLQGRILFMFDDAHKLSKSQRKAFLDYLTVKRSDYSLWIAERLEALDEQESFGSYVNRDYAEINLEEIWQGSTSKFKNILMNIATKRASMSSEEVKSFQDYLDDYLKESEYENKFIKASEQSLQNMQSFSRYTLKFEQWIEYLKSQQPQLTPLNFCVLCRQTEILAYRNLGKTQLALDFQLSIEELKQKLGGEIQTNALYFVCMEQKIPYYYGFDDLVKLSSNNIEQFLSFAGDLFEIMLARKISDKPINVDATEQERLLKKIANHKWKELVRLIPNSHMVLRFLQNIASFSKSETNKPNAPYAPGINGFAIKEIQVQKLIGNVHWLEDSTYSSLISVLRICMAYNLLEKRLTKQGKENTLHTVYYLNRWICLRFNLPFSYGGFRHKSPGELLKWIK